MRALILAILLAGCAKNAATELDAFADRACACSAKHDTACAKTVLAELGAFFQSTKHAKGEEAKAAQAARRAGDCLLAAGVTSSELAAALVKPEPEPAPGSAESGSAGSGSAGSAPAP
ncbi:MAG TPA: hypothetical protein VFQ53_08325 [Kofleriaceae bacterium]|nr:hypothetical protein [Kofleriaceae bacterium]